MHLFDLIFKSLQIQKKKIISFRQFYGVYYFLGRFHPVLVCQILM